MREVYLSASQLALLFQVDRRTIQRWAKADHWRAHGPRHARAYSLSDASATVEARQSVQRDTRVDEQVV